MRRDRNRDYATDAFQFSAQVGGYDKYHASLHDRLTKEVAEHFQGPECPSDGGEISDPEQAAHEHYNILIAQYEPELLDLQAVKETERLLIAMGHESTKWAAVKAVYQRDLNVELSGEIVADFVYTASREIFASPSSIYDWLYDARAIFTLYNKRRLTNGQFARLERLHII
jgi:hypothetical protein